MEKTLQELTQDLITVAQRDYLLDAIDTLQSSLFSSHQTIYELISLALPLPWSDLVTRMCREQNLLEQDKDGCRALLADIKTTVSSLESIEMRVAYNMCDADVKDVKNWLFFQLKRQILLNIIVDPSLIGGIVLYRNGTYRDYSVATHIDQYGRV